MSSLFLVAGPGGGDVDIGGGCGDSGKILVGNQISFVSVVYKKEQDKNSLLESQAVIFL